MKNQKKIYQEAEIKEMETKEAETKEAEIKEAEQNLAAVENTAPLTEGELAAMDAIRKDLEGRFSGTPVDKMRFAVAYSGAKTEEVDAWVNDVEAAFPGAKVEFAEPLSLSVSCHIGAGALAVTATVPLK